jgi:hypothetical protein
MSTNMYACDELVANSPQLQWQEPVTSVQCCSLILAANIVTGRVVLLQLYR